MQLYTGNTVPTARHEPKESDLFGIQFYKETSSPYLNRKQNTEAARDFNRPVASASRQ
jgi:hypothetical protein